MKYKKDHIPEFVGAVGTCPSCGLEVELQKEDKIIRYETFNGDPYRWYVKCPECGKTIKCE